MSKILIPLISRGILSLKGLDRKIFLQGLVTQDLTLLNPSQALYSALLTPQGKFLHDFFLIEQEEEILLETQSQQIDLLRKRLAMFKLRHQVTIEDVSKVYQFFICLQDQQEQRGQVRSVSDILQFSDPRLKELGSRWIKKKDTPYFCQVSFEDEEIYEKHRINLGIPETGQEMIPDKSIPLEIGLQDLNAISWTKGCYMGQELTARTKYRGEIRKRLFPIKLASEIHRRTDFIMADKIYKAGEIYSIYENLGIARLRLEYLDQPLTINGISVYLSYPDWIKI